MHPGGAEGQLVRVSRHGMPDAVFTATFVEACEQVAVTEVRWANDRRFVLGHVHSKGWTILRHVPSRRQYYEPIGTRDCSDVAERFCRRCRERWVRDPDAAHLRIVVVMEESVGGWPMQSRGAQAMSILLALPRRCPLLQVYVEARAPPGGLWRPADFGGPGSVLFELPPLSPAELSRIAEASGGTQGSSREPGFWNVRSLGHAADVVLVACRVAPQLRENTPTNTILSSVRGGARKRRRLLPDGHDAPVSEADLADAVVVCADTASPPIPELASRAAASRAVDVLLSAGLLVCERSGDAAPRYRMAVGRDASTAAAARTGLTGLI
eukprot:TRINITY_DN12047_c0_g1_i4.p1 TRINITY_DN12047_c0_g1~~TRINITY_DN12047_c0_g1_i4.p1  ORF type:complete len:326 (+),score=37.55 TRINITY_DN12047_c0_g1_i4:445-1422(+)